MFALAWCAGEDFMKWFVTILLLLSTAQSQDAEVPVGRLLLLSFSGDEAPLDRLEAFTPAGFIFYPGNVTSTEGVRAVTKTLQEASPYPLLFGIDQEGGPFTSYRVDEATLFPGAMALAATGDTSSAYRVGEATALELSHAGFNLLFGPVADVYSNPDNPIIGVRSFGAEPEMVSAFALAYQRGVLEAGVAPVAKHFPGHGDTDTDTHLALARIGKSKEKLEAVDLAPFRALIEGGIPAVMSAHIVFPALDPADPATLSRPVLTGLLREQLGFKGLVITDYMDMRAIADHYGAGEAALRSVLAGADLVIVGPDPAVQREVYDALLEAYRTGRLPEERVREAVARSQKLAERFVPQREDSPPDYAAHKALAEAVASKGATLLSNDGVLPLDPQARVLVVAPQPNAYGSAPHLGSILKRHREDVASVVVSEAPTPSEVEEALAKSAAADVIVLGTYHWLGAFPEAMTDLATRLTELDKPLVVVALGNPDDGRFLDVQPSAYLAAYGYREANLKGVTAVLLGRVEPTGRLPVPVGTWPVGSGMSGF